MTQLVAARDADPELGFMARLLALCSLPRTNPGNRTQYVRRNGPYTLGMSAGINNKLPYGTRPRLLRRWCTNRNWHATVPTTGASSTDGVGSWAAHVGHRIQHIARELRFDRSPTGCPGSKTIADDRRIPEEGVLDSRVLMVA